MGIGVLVNQTMEATRPKDNATAEPRLNYENATRLLAERLLTACGREVTLADMEADRAGTLSEAALERLLAGAMSPEVNENENPMPPITEAETESWDQAMRGEIANDEAPAILGIQVHKIPLWAQCGYLVLVFAAACYVVMLVVNKLTGGKEKKDKDSKKGKKA